VVSFIRAIPKLPEAVHALCLNILDGTHRRHMKRHRHQEFIRFLNTIEAQVLSSITMLLTSIRKGVRGLPGIPRWTFHFTPTSASWLNAIEGSLPS
jgi:hypothetical protein